MKQLLSLLLTLLISTMAFSVSAENSAVEINFNEYDILSYDGDEQDVEQNSYSIGHNGKSITFTGNSWKALNLPTNANNLKLSFYLKDNTEKSEIVGIGFEDDLELNHDPGREALVGDEMSHIGLIGSDYVKSDSPDRSYSEDGFYTNLGAAKWPSSLDLVFTNRKGIEYNIPFVDESATVHINNRFGNKEDDFIFQEQDCLAVDYRTAAIGIDDYFVVTDEAESDDAYTRVLTFESVDIDEELLIFSDVSEGSDHEVAFIVEDSSARGGVAALTELIVGGESYAVRVYNSGVSAQEDEYKVCIDLDNSGAYEAGAIVPITLKGGSILSVESFDATSVELSHKVLAKYTDNTVEQKFFFTLFGENGETVDLDYHKNSTIGLERQNSMNSDITEGMTSFGVQVQETELDNDAKADLLTLEVPEDQVIAKVFVNGSNNDSFQFGRSSDLLELNQPIGDVKNTLTSDDLDLLASREITTVLGTTDADQYLKFNEVAGLIPVFEDNKENIVSDYLYAEDGGNIFNYEQVFPHGLQSRTFANSASTEIVVDGNASLNDIVGKELFILGETFFIRKAEIIEGYLSDSVELVLQSGGTDSLIEEQTKRYKIDGKEYQVTVLIISHQKDNVLVKLMVNGEVTKSLAIGDRQTLEDGTVIHIQEIVVNEPLSGNDVVTFSLGNLLELKDDDYGDREFTEQVVVNGETVEDAEVQISLDRQEGFVTLHGIEYRLNADAAVPGDLYISKGATLRETLDESEGLLSSAWDVTYGGLSQPESTSVNIIPTTKDNAYTLEFTNQEGIDYAIPLVRTSRETVEELSFGNGEDTFVLMEQECSNREYSIVAIGEDDYFALTGTDNTGEKDTRILRFEGVNTLDQLYFVDVATNEEYTSSFDVDSTVGSSGIEAKPIEIDGAVYKLRVYSNEIASPGSEYRVCIDLNGDGYFQEGAIGNLAIEGDGEVIFTDLEYEYLAVSGLEMAVSTPRNPFAYNVIIADSHINSPDTSNTKSYRDGIIMKIGKNVDVVSAFITTRDHFFQAAGTQPWGSYQERSTSPEHLDTDFPLEEGWRYYEIDVSHLFGGSFNHLVFANDADLISGTNVTIGGVTLETLN